MRVMAMLCALAAGCATSSYQTAKMLPPGATQVGVAANSYSYHEGGNGSSEEALEVMGSTGISETLEIGAKAAWFNVSDTGGGDDVNFFNFLLTPKISITPDKLAIVAQTGFIYATGSGDSENAWMTMPGIVFTSEVTSGIYVDLCAKLIGFFSDNFDDYNFAGGGNAGIRIQPTGAAWSVGPELGFMYDDDSSSSASDDTGYFLQFGVGFHYTFGGAQAAPASSSAPPPPPASPAGPPPPPPPPDPSSEPPP
jgi:hypothetical protein